MFRNLAQRAAMLAALALSLVAFPLVANAQNPGGYYNGHYYEVIESNGITWAAAKAAADARTYGDAIDAEGFDDVFGHLATITSAGEDEFLDALRADAYSDEDLSRPEIWVGGSQPSESATDEDWAWENGDGNIPGDNDSGPEYANWLGGEPNDSGDGESELAIGLGNQFGWNDEGALGNIGGYVIEYDVPLDTGPCLSVGGCDLTEGITITLPPINGGPGASIDASTYTFTDPRDCDAPIAGRPPLSLFDGDLIIPPYLCGSPDFVVVKTVSNGFTITSGTVLIETDPGVAVPSNDPAYVCSLPVTGDPQLQDVVVWQATNLNTMLETTLGAVAGAAFDGSAAEVTDACGSSIARTRDKSFMIAGMHIDFGGDSAWTATPDFVVTSFVALTRYKLVVLIAAIDAAKPVLKNGDFTKLRQQASNALASVDKGDYSTALTHIGNFLKFVNAAKYSQTTFNHNGEHLMRGLNIQFMLKEKIIPYAP